MGNNQIQDLYSSNQIFLYDINQIDKADLLFQSKLSIISYSTKLMKKVYNFTSASQNITSYINKLRLLGQFIECQNLMVPIYCYIRQPKKICSEQRQLQIYHQIYNINIREQIQIRKKLNQRFSQNEIWFLLLSIVNAVRIFQPLKIKSGDLKSDSIQLNQKGHLKLKNILTQPQYQYSSLPNYYAPEELYNMRQKRKRKIHLNICQTFSIAIIVLQICTYKHGESFYDMFRMKINQVVLEHALQILQKLSYSKLLIKLLNIMLSSQKDRPLPSQIYLAFKPYQKQIFSLQNFAFDPHEIYSTLQNSRASKGINY